MTKVRITTVLILILGVLAGYFIFASEPWGADAPGSVWTKNHPFKLGLDLSGGSHLVYRADVSEVSAGDISDSMSAVRDVIERRVNALGVSEPLVQVQSGGLGAAGEERLIVDLPGVTDVQEAQAKIGQTPFLEFRLEDPDAPAPEAKVGPDGTVTIDQNVLYARYKTTGLSGKYLKRAELVFDQNTNEPTVSLQFNDDGSKLFAEITKENVGKVIGIFLDNVPISLPVVREEIKGGNAQISGDFDSLEARELVRNLNFGALPVKIELISTQTIGAALGDRAVADGMRAALFGFAAVAIFLILWYRLPGLLAVLALCVYATLVLMLFKLIPIVLTAAGVAGFIVSLGIAVDANVLIFARLKEELAAGHAPDEALSSGFSRAWFSIRDSNFSSLITAAILFWFGTSLIRGFAITFGLGVLVSLFSSMTVSRLFLMALGVRRNTRAVQLLFGSGFK